MILNKLRKISILAIAFVFAISLGFGIYGFASQKTASAAEAVATVDWTAITVPSVATNNEVYTYNGYKMATNAAKIKTDGTKGIQMKKSALVFYIGAASKVTFELNGSGSSGRVPKLIAISETQYNAFDDGTKYNEPSDDSVTDETIYINGIDGAGASLTTDISTLPVELPIGYYKLFQAADSTNNWYVRKTTVESLGTPLTTAESIVPISKGYSEINSLADLGLPATINAYEKDSTTPVSCQLDWSANTDFSVGTRTFTAKVTAPEGYAYSGAAISCSITITDDRAVVLSVVAIEESVSINSTYVLPTTISGTITGDVSVADIPVTWNGTASTASVGTFDFVGTITASGKYRVDTVSTVAAQITVVDLRKTISAFSAVETSYIVAKNGMNPLPTTISGTTNEGSENFSIVWDSVDLTKIGANTVNGTITVDPSAYTLGADVSASISTTVKVYGTIDKNVASIGAIWEKGAFGVCWTGTNSTAKITSDVILAESDGVVITALNGKCYSDYKTEAVEMVTNALVKFDASAADVISIVVPEGFSGQIKIKASPFSDNSGKRYSALTLKNASGTYNETINSAKDKAYGVGSGVTSYDNLLQYEFVWNVTEGGTYMLSNGNDYTCYVSNISVGNTQTVSDCYYQLYDGQNFPTITPEVGYTFVGWTSDNGLTFEDSTQAVDADGEYLAVSAKINFLGAGIRIAAVNGIRFCFTMDFYNIIPQQTMKNLQANLAVEYNLHATQDNKFAATSFVVDGSTIEFNAVLINIAEANFTRLIVANAKATINNVEIATANDVAKSANGVAEAAFGAGEITAEQAAIYGYIAS